MKYIIPENVWSAEGPIHENEATEKTLMRENLSAEKSQLFGIADMQFDRCIRIGEDMVLKMQKGQKIDRRKIIGFHDYVVHGVVLMPFMPSSTRNFISCMGRLSISRLTAYDRPSI